MRLLLKLRYSFAGQVVCGLSLSPAAVCPVLPAGLAVEPASNDLYCLPGYDIRGDQAQGGDIETPVAVQSEVVTASARECAGVCRTTTGCQYFVQKAAACYLKQNLIGGKFGVTGAAPDVIVTCVRGTDSWMQLGSILEISGVVPAPLDFTSTLGGGLNGVLNPGVAPGTYSCLPELSLNGTLMKSVSLTGDDAGRLGCAANCDATPGCVAHTLSALGACNLLSAIQVGAREGATRGRLRCDCAGLKIVMGQVLGGCCGTCTTACSACAASCILPCMPRVQCVLVLPLLH
jgi:hypothetical protein